MQAEDDNEHSGSELPLQDGDGEVATTTVVLAVDVQGDDTSHAESSADTDVDAEFGLPSINDSEGTSGEVNGDNSHDVASQTSSTNSSDDGASQTSSTNSSDDASQTSSTSSHAGAPISYDRSPSDQALVSVGGRSVPQLVTRKRGMVRFIEVVTQGFDAGQ